jgi:hypothetical protein
MRRRRCAAGRRGGSGWLIGRTSAFLTFVAATLVGPAALHAQNLEQYDYENLRLRAIGVEGVWANAKDVEGAFGFGLRADLGPLGPNVRVVPRFAWWKADIKAESIRQFESNLEDLCTPPGCNVELGSVQRNFWIVGLDLQWLPDGSPLAPYFGVGGDLYIIDDSGQAIEDTFLADAVVTAGLSGVVGAQLDLKRHMRIYADVRGTLVSSASSIAVYVGIAYRF